MFVTESSPAMPPLAQEAVSVAKHLSKFYTRGERDWSEFERWRSLHCRTNGFSTDVLNAIIRGTNRKVTFDTVSGVAGTFTKRERRHIVNSLRRDGIYIFPNLIDGDVVRRLREYAYSHQSEAYPAVDGKPPAAIYDPNDPIASTCWHPQDALFTDETVQDMVADPSLMAFAGEYLRVVPRVMTLAMWHSSHKFKEVNGQGAQMYHFDLSQPGWINFFVYLHDVTPESGPHAFVKGSHRRDREGAHLRARGIVRIPDEDVVATYGEERIMKVCGPAGTLFAADTRAFHKGIKPTSADRLVFQVSYSNSVYSHPIDVIKAPAKSSVLKQAASTYPEAFTRFQPQ